MPTTTSFACRQQRLVTDLCDRVRCEEGGSREPRRVAAGGQDAGGHDAAQRQRLQKTINVTSTRPEWLTRLGLLGHV